MTTVAIAGASGVVGARALHHLLERADVGRVIALGRRPLSVGSEKLVSKVADLQDAEAMAAELPDEVDAGICCLGTTMKKAGSKEAFRAVDLHAVVAFARATRERGARRFVLVSSLGADPAARNFYLRTKGEAEQALSHLGFEQLTLLRPSLIDDQGARQEFRAGEHLALPIARAVFRVVGRTHRYAPIAADTIGRAAVALAFDETNDRVRVVESDRLHACAG